MQSEQITDDLHVARIPIGELLDELNASVQRQTIWRASLCAAYRPRIGFTVRRARFNASHRSRVSAVRTWRWRM